MTVCGTTPATIHFRPEGELTRASAAKYELRPTMIGSSLLEVSPLIFLNRGCALIQMARAPAREAASGLSEAQKSLPSGPRIKDTPSIFCATLLSRFFKSFRKKSTVKTPAAGAESESLQARLAVIPCCTPSTNV